MVVLMTLRAAIYARVSSDPKGIGRSVAEQETECRAVIEREGWLLVRTYRDTDRSASRHATKVRPAYQELVRYLSEGRADVLVCWEASRAQRDLQAYVKLRDTCAQNGVRWSYSGRLYDLGRTDDRFTTGLDALLAERESDVTRDRVLRAVRANAAAGRPHGRLLYGYRREYDPASGRLLAQLERADQAAVVREAARRVLAGESLYGVARDLQVRGIAAPHGDRWWPETVKRLLVNPGYAGRRVHDGKIVGDADWPALLAEDDAAKLDAILNDPSRRTRRDGSIRHLLSGIAKCGRDGCDNTVRAQRNRTYMAYIATPCFHVSRRQDHVDDLVTRTVVGRLARPDAAGLFAPSSDDDASKARTEAAELRARLEAFYAAAADDKVTPAGLARIEAALLPKIEDADRRGVPSTLPRVLRDVGHQVDVGAWWAALSMLHQREVIRTLVDVRILPTRQGQRRFDPESVAIEWRTL